MTIKEIKEFCISVDLDLIKFGHFVGVTDSVCEGLIEFKSEKDVRIFYNNINIKTLLEIFSQYNVLEEYSKNVSLEDNHYNIDILDLIKHL